MPVPYIRNQNLHPFGLVLWQISITAFHPAVILQRRTPSCKEVLCPEVPNVKSDMCPRTRKKSPDLLQVYAWRLFLDSLHPLTCHRNGGLTDNERLIFHSTTRFRVYQYILVSHTDQPEVSLRFRRALHFPRAV